MPRKAPAPRRRGGFILWMALAILAFVGFVALGNWQVRRLHWKLGLIHDVTTRVHASPVAAPGPAKWSHIDNGHLQYLHVRLKGRFIDGKQTLVHGPSKQGYGYWVLAPLQTDRGFIVLVNRGYIPDSLPGTPAYARTLPPEGEVTLSGLLRFTEPGGGFLRHNRPREGQWYSRDVAAMARADGLPAGKVAPYFVDADAGQGRGDLPMGGLTRVHFRNHHLGYAITWYLLGLGTLLCAGIVIRHRWRMRDASSV